jgi:hypothetical protein
LKQVNRTAEAQKIINEVTEIAKAARLTDLLANVPEASPGG